MNLSIIEAKELSMNSKRHTAVRCILNLLGTTGRGNVKGREFTMQVRQQTIKERLMKWDLSEE